MTDFSGDLWMTHCFAIAKKAQENGVSFAPAKQDGSKSPIGPWRQYMQRIPSDDEIQGWRLTGQLRGLFVICGAVSGNLEMFEAESAELFDAYTEAAAAVGLGDLWEAVASGYLSGSPGGSRHVLLRCDEIAGNTKLARRKVEVVSNDDGASATEIQVLFETRGEGGGSIEPPSSGGVHPSGGEYTQIRGGFDTILEISPEERTSLYALARTFDEMPVEPAREPRERGRPRQSSGTRPGDDFNNRTTWAEILEPEGWTWLYQRGQIDYWRRPGKNEGVSATTNVHDLDLLKVFSSSTPFDTQRTYSRFGTYALLHHAGDFQAARRELFSEGFGHQTTQQTPPPPNEPPGGPPDPPEPNEPEMPPPPASRPTIDAGDADLERTATQAWRALEAANRPERLFTFGRSPVRIEGGENGSSPFAQILTEDRLGHELARAAVWLKPTKDNGPKPAAPSNRLIKDLLAHPNYPLPELQSIVQTPVLAPDGSLQTERGYHAAALTYYVPARGFVVPPVPDVPTGADVVRAKALILDELLGDFPFISEAERANAFALALDRYLRNMINGFTPLRLIEAPTPGSGKGLLADVVLRPATGTRISIMPAANDDDEWRKRITAQLMLMPSVILIDNVVKALDSGSLSAVLTSDYWTDRRLGANEMVNVPVRCTFICTANNPTMSTELARRTVRIRLDPKVDRPWQRTGFRHEDLRSWVDENRPHLVWAGLVLGRHWVAEGMPKGTVRLGSYEHWSAVMGGVLGAAGVDGFLGNLNEFYEESDLEGAIWRQFVAVWFDRFGEGEVGVADLFGLATNVEGFDFGKGNERSQKTAFGSSLTKQRDRVIGEYRIVNTRTVQRAKKWRLIRNRGGANPFNMFYETPPRDSEPEPPEHEDEAGDDAWTR